MDIATVFKAGVPTSEVSVQTWQCADTSDSQMVFRLKLQVQVVQLRGIMFTENPKHETQSWSRKRETFSLLLLKDVAIFSRKAHTLCNISYSACLSKKNCWT